MKNSPITCDEQLLKSVLDEELPDPVSDEVLDHIESCVRCQQRISDLAGSAADWARLTAIMADSLIPTADLPSIDLAGLRQHSVHWTESMARGLLSPPSHPEMLGRLGRYEIERLIGSGGMGVVFKGFDQELNRPVAVKLLALHLGGSGPARKRFAREARAAAAVMHQHVVPIYNVEASGELPYIVMQYVSGESLQDRLDRDGPLELCEILRIGMQVADGLSAAHQQGLVHRDIKPSNILLEEAVDRALITDFGLARAADDASLTRTGFHPGTPQYMSPEQASGESLDARSDVFSLGSVLYTMSTGRPPFRADSSLGVMRRIVESEPTPIRELNPAIPDWMCSLVGRLMAKRPEDRFQSASDAHGALEACLCHVQQPQTAPLPEILGSVNRRPSLFRQLLSGKHAMKTLLVIAALLVSLILIPYLGVLVTRTETGQAQESAFMPSFRAAERIDDQDRRYQAFAALARNAAEAGDINMTTRALEHIRQLEVRSPVKRDCAIIFYRKGRHEDAYALADGIYNWKERNEALFVLAGGAEPQNPPAANDAPTPLATKELTARDLTAIQGTWQVTYSEDSGRVAPQELLKELRFVFGETSLVTQSGDRQSDATFLLDASTSPKSITLTENERTKLGIYDLDGDTLRLCIAERTDIRPTSFDSKPDSANDVVIILKRLPPPTR